ncbi:hypothetical protein [Halovenus sp. HT40]|uniref:hypothetical protein n=1 Tax=Halovenus sp. HT40 TaxID=3126691 RepID=UPI00300E81E5
MNARPGPAYVAATVVAAVLAIVGAYLPWVKKHPDGYRNGQAYYTSEYLPAAEAGFQGLDVVVVALGVAVIGVVAGARYRGWLPDVVLLGSGVVLLLLSGDRLKRFRPVERYTVEPGLYLVLVSGLLLVLVGAGALLRRRIVARIAEDSDQEVG